MNTFGWVLTLGAWGCALYWNWRTQAKIEWLEEVNKILREACERLLTEKVVLDKLLKRDQLARGAEQGERRYDKQEQQHPHRSSGPARP